MGSEKFFVCLLLFVSLLILVGCAPKNSFPDYFYNSTLEGSSVNNRLLYCDSPPCNYTSRVFDFGFPVIWRNISFSPRAGSSLYARVCSTRSCANERFEGPFVSDFSFKRARFFQYKLVINQKSAIKPPLISVDVENKPPKILPLDSLEFYEDQSMLINLSSVVSDPDDSLYYLSFSGYSSNSLVEVRFDRYNLLAYLIPSANKSGNDVVNISVSDGSSSPSISFSISVKPVDDAPWADLISPSDGFFNHSSNYIDFVFVPHDTESDVVNCSVVIEGKFNETVSTALDAENSVNVYLDDGEYSWHVFCYDYSSFSSSESRDLYVGINPRPKVVFLNPNNGTVTNLSSVNFSFSVLDNNPDNCTLLLDGSPSANFSRVESNFSYSYSLNVSALPHSWNVDCADAFNLHSRSPLQYFDVDLSPPVVSLVFPPDSYLSDTSIIFFKVDVEDPNLDACVLYGSWSDWQPNLTSRSSSFPPAYLREGFYFWNVLCNDTVGNSAFSDSNFTLYIGSKPESNASKPGPLNLTAKHLYSTNNIDGCWYLIPYDDSTSYLMNMVMCPESPKEEPRVNVRSWCNGTEVELNNGVWLHVNSLGRNPSYSLDMENNKTFYCPWCFDKVKNYDEEGVDCGPSCQPCTASLMSGGEEFACGDGVCSPGEGCFCVSDCLGKVKASLSSIVLLVFLIYLVWYLRNRRKSYHSFVLFVLFVLSMWFMTRSLCFCDSYCDIANNSFIILLVASSLFFMVFNSGSIYALLRHYSLYAYSRFFLNDRDYNKIVEIKDLIRRSYETLPYDDSAAYAIFRCIKPIYNTLSPEGKKSLVKSIIKLRNRIRSVGKRDYFKVGGLERRGGL